MPKPTLAQRSNFKAYLRYYKSKFSDTTIPEFYIDDILTTKASGISTTDNVKVVPFNNFGTEDVSTNVANNTLFYLPALSNDTVTLAIGSSSYTFKFVGEDGGITYNGTTYTLGDSISVGNKSLIVKGLGGALLQPADPPVYTISQSSASVNEGQSVTFTINTQNVGAGAVLYWNTAGSMASSDFSDNSLTGSFTIVGTGATTGIGTVVRSIATDFLTEGSESFTLTIRTGSSSGTVVATSSAVSVGDVVPTFSLTESSNRINEGSTVTFNVSGSNIPTGTYYWTIEQQSGIVAAADFSPQSLSGTVSISGSSGSFSILIRSDYVTDGTDSFYVNLRRDSITGTVVAASGIITINDTSTNVGQNANGLTFGPVQVNRDNGNAANTSDWYTICDLDNVPEGSSIALFIDGSGSMTQANVQASYELLVSKLAARNITITTVTNPNEDWITPFLVDLP